jgi:hypothetical protein
MTDKQYTKNLNGNQYGLKAVSCPFEMKERTGRVGDIGYLDRHGYHCVINAFDTLVVHC